MTNLSRSYRGGPADHHSQHIYDKFGVSTRAAATLWAMQNAVVT